MDRNGLALVFLFSFLVLADASLISSYRKFAVKERDSLPDSTVPIPGSESGGKKSDEKTVNDSNSGNKLNLNEPSKENKLSSETENQTSVGDKTSGSDDVNKDDKDKKSGEKMVNEKGEGSKPGSEPEVGTDTGKESDPGKESKPSKEEKSDPKPAEELKKEESDPGKKQSEEDKKSGSESGKDESKGKKPDTKPVSGVSEDDPAPPVPKDSPVSKSSSGTGTENSPPQGEKAEKKEQDKVEKDKKTDDKSENGIVTDETCNVVSLSCTIQKDLIGCIKSSDDGSKVVVIVQNKGDSNLKANVAAENTGKGLEYEILKKQSKLISVTITNKKTSSIVLRDANGKCEIPLHQPASEEIPFLKLPTYDQLVTPVNGAYLLILSAVIFGGTFTCIKFSKRGRQGGGGGVRYQELEMGVPDSVSAADLESAEGWDEGWDDDWDDDNGSVKSPVAHHTGNISANGLTSRAPNKDGWEDNWDD